MSRKQKKVMSFLFAICMVFNLMPTVPALGATVQQVTTNTTLSSNTICDDGVVTVDLAVTGKKMPGIVLPNDVVLLLDCSGSMSLEGRFASMQQAAKRFIDLVDFSVHRVGIVSYESGVGTFNITDDKDALKNYIDSLTIGGTTQTDLAINAAASMLQSKRDDVIPSIVLLSDGYASNQSAAELQATAAKNQGITIYTVALLGEQEMADPESSGANQSLKRISTSGGHHHFVGPDGVSGVYGEIAQQIGEANVYNVKITQEIDPAFELVPGSADNNIPRPVINGNTLTWEMQELREETLHLTYQLRAKTGIAKGTYENTTAGSVEYETYEGEAKTVSIAPVPINVIYSPIIDSIMPSDYAIQGGEKAVLKGKNFDASTIIRLGTVSIPNVTVIDDETIEFVMPAHAQGTAEISAMKPGSKTATVPVRFLATPEVTEVKPASGVYEGGTLVRLETKYVMSGATVTFDGVPADVTTYSKSYIKVKSPFLDKAGAVDIVVTNPDGTSVVVTDGFTYEPKPGLPELILSAITPASGPEGEATLVRVSGSNFRNGAGFKVTVGGEEATVTVVSKSYIKFTVPTILAAGTYDVVVTNDDGTEATLANAYTYIGKPAEPAPTLTAITPASGPEGEATLVRVSGSNFRNGAGFKVTVGGEEATVTVVSKSYIKFTVPTTLAAGTYDVVVTNDDGTETTLANAYTYIGKPAEPAPTLTAITPASGPEGEATLVRVSGSNFRNGTGFKVTVGGVEATVTIVSKSYIKFTVPTTLAAGTYDVVVTNDDGTEATLANAYTYIGKPAEPAPTLTAITPASGPEGEATLVRVSGSNFRNGAGFKVTVGGEEATVTVVSKSYIKFTVPTTLAAGTYDVVVTNDDGTETTLANAYTYIGKPAEPAPTLTAITPASGPEGEATLVRVSGSNFRNGAGFKVTVGGEEATVTVVSKSYIKFTVPTTLAAGTYDVVVTNDDGTQTTMPGAYTYDANPVVTDPAPTLTAISPANGPEGEETLVRITGKDFRNGVQVTIGGMNATVTIVSGGYIKFQTPAALTAGTYDVVVANVDGTQTTMTDAFTCDAKPAAPTFTVDNVLPASGLVDTATVVRISGSNISAGADMKVTIGGIDAVITASTSSYIKFQSPSGLPAGVYNVVVTNGDGTQITMPDAYTYIAKPTEPAPTLNVVSPSSGPVGQATLVRITGSNFRSGAGFKVTVGGQDAVVTIVSKTYIKFTVPTTLAAGTYDIVVTNDDGTQSTLAGAYTYQ